MSGPDVTFTPSNAKAEAGKDPWKRTNDFTTEIDPGEMLATSREFANAGGEAGYAGELAVSASEETADAAEIGGQKMHDIEAHVAETSNLLQGDGEALFGVAEKLGTVVELAEESIDFVEARIEQLDEDLPALSDEGQTEMDNFATEIWTEYLKTVNDLPEGVELEKFPVVVLVSYGGEEYRALNGVVPSDLADAVAEYWLERGATAVKNADTAIEEALDEYHASLTKISSDLGEYGYTGAGAPVSIFHTEQMAEYQAERLRVAIEEEDFDAIHDASRFVGDIANRISDPPGTELTDRERDFLHAFYGALSAEDLAALGNLEQSLNPYGATERDLRIAQGVIGDGILALTNPEANGVEVPAHLPQSIYDLVYGAEVGTEKPDGYEALAGYDPDTGEFVVSGLSEYLGFSSLMEHSTLAPGHDFGVAMAESAIRVETQFNALMANVEASGGYTGVTVATPDGYMTLDDDLEEKFRSLHPGGSEVLEVVSRNVDASQSFLSTPENLETMMGLGWGDRGERGTGASAVLEVATDRSHSDPGRARTAAELAQSVFTTVADDPTTWREMVPKGSAISDAMVDIAAQYIDVFSAFPDGDGEPVNYDAAHGQFKFVLGGGEGGMNFLEFVGMMDEGASVEDFLGDPDSVKLRAAADVFYAERYGIELDKGEDGATGTVSKLAGRIYGNLARYDIEAAASLQQDEVDAVELAGARRKIITDAAWEVAAVVPGARGVKLATDGISNEMVKAYTTKALEQVVNAGVAEAKKPYDQVVVEGLGYLVGKEEEWGARVSASRVMADQLSAHMTETRVEQNLVALRERDRRDPDGLDQLDNSFRDSEGKLKSARDLSDNQIDIVNDLAEEGVGVEGTSTARHIWDETNDQLVGIGIEEISGRGSVDTDLVERLRTGRRE
ncbi:hypothetical protein [Streptomyces bohaiensis]|uniref:putative alpha/beta hydrolase n=1 Tax=Streptomyces bohaiensis TaxID=1431344 RepID=UPI003B7BE3E4